MEQITLEIYNLLVLLLPGFIVAYVFYAVTSFPKKSEFEAIVIALIFTTIVQLIVQVIKQNVNSWTTLQQSAWSFGVAIIFALLFAFLINNDLIHKFLRLLRITTQTSYPSEWYGIFTTTTTYVVLHLGDGRRIYGWPYEWPNKSDAGHFVLTEAE